MAHFAKLDKDGVVVAVFVGREEDDGKEQELSERTGDTYKQTSYNTYGGVHLLGGTPLRKNYAGIGYLYDSTRDAFIPPQPFSSWTLNEETCRWDPPTEYPADGSVYRWNEDGQSWGVLEEPSL